MRFSSDAMDVGNKLRIDKVKKEARLLSLASSIIFVGVFAIFYLAYLNNSSGPVNPFIERNRAFLLFVPLVMPVAAIVRLTSLRFSRNTRLPFIDCWFVHILILIPYAILFRIIVSF